MNSKKNRRRLLLSIMSVFLLVMTFAGSTYAWFTANRTVTVSDIDVNVAASNGIQVSVDGINWKTVISNEDITGANVAYPGAVNQLPTGANSLTPVSTIGDIDTSNGFINMFTGAIDSNLSGDYILTATQSVETHGTAGAFVAFDLFMQVTEDTDIYLTSNSAVVADGASTGIENASRMAFVLQGTTSVGSDAATIQAMIADQGTEQVVIWEMNNDAHTAPAVANASSNYGVVTAAGTGNAAIPYHGVRADIITADDELLDSTNVTFFAPVTPDISTDTAGILTTAYESAFSLTAGITKVRVYMWLEGQDVDCENNASGGAVTYSLQFSSNTQA